VVAKEVTAIVCVPAVAADAAVAVSAFELDDVAISEFSTPSGSFSALAADFSAFRFDVIVASVKLSVLMVAC